MELTKEGVVRVDEVNGVKVIQFLSGEIRQETEVLRTLENMAKYVDENPGVGILLNMEQIEYLSSAGLGNLVGILKKSRKANGVFKLCCLQDSIRELFDVMRLSKIFEMYGSQDEALASF